MDYIVFLRNLGSNEEIELHLPMEEEDLREVVEKLNPNYDHDMLISDAWNEDGENYWKYSEYADIFEVNELLQAIEDSNVSEKVINAYIECEDAFESAEEFNDVNWDDIYLYSNCDTLADYAREYIEDCYCGLLKDLPNFIADNIDYDGVAQDLASYGSIYETSYGVLEIN